jgi:hypothetical protein
MGADPTSALHVRLERRRGLISEPIKAPEYFDASFL